MVTIIDNNHNNNSDDDDCRVLSVFTQSFYNESATNRYNQETECL